MAGDIHLIAVVVLSEFVCFRSKQINFNTIYDPNKLWSKANRTSLISKIL